MSSESLILTPISQVLWTGVMEELKDVSIVRHEVGPSAGSTL